MSKLNEKLIDKVKSGKAAIEHTQKSEDLQRLYDIIAHIKAKECKWLTGSHRYYYMADNALQYVNHQLPSTYEILQISSFFTEEKAEVIPSDKESLNRISELLAELKPLIYGVSHLIDQDCYNPYAHIAPVEPNTIAQTEEVEPIKEERWEITIEPFRYNSKDNRITLALTNDNILSEAEANEIALKIKQLLKEL